MPKAKPLSKEQILAAMSRTKSNRAGARYCGCSYTHYKRYAKLYKDENGVTLFDKHLNPHGWGIPKFLSTKGSQAQVASIYDVIEGRVPMEHFTPQKIRDKLIVEGLLKDECYKCGFHERRILDYKIPLILSFVDGNKKNYLLPNLELLCYNCYYIWVGDLFTPKQVIHLEDYIPTPKTQDVDWEVNDHFKEHFANLGLIEKPKPLDGEEFISRI